jgi:hypothetical protein
MASNREIKTPANPASPEAGTIKVDAINNRANHVLSEKNTWE